jgi:hypothetical protein
LITIKPKKERKEERGRRKEGRRKKTRGNETKQKQILIYRSMSGLDGDENHEKTCKDREKGLLC